MRTDATYLGTVQDVQGATISIALDKDTVSGLVFIDGQGYRIGQVGSFVRISIGFTDLFGIVSQVGAGAVPEAIAKIEPHGYRWLKVQLIGEGQRGKEFRRGITQYPTIGDQTHLVTEQDLTRIYGRPEAPNFVRIGSLASSESIPALIDVNSLITRHSAVLGTTGAGKSTTVASLLLALTEPLLFPSARIIVLDIHGEYSTAMRERSTVFKINADETQGEKSLCIPYWALSFDELLRVTPFRNLNDADRAALLDKVRELKQQSLSNHNPSGLAGDTITVDTPCPFSIHKMWYDLHRFVCSTHTAPSANQRGNETEAIERDSKGELMMGDILRVVPPKYKPITQGGTDRVYLSGAPLNIRRQISALESLLRDTRYNFLFRPGSWCPDTDGKPQKELSGLLSDWIGGEKPITILDLSGVPSSILVDLIGVVIRIVFDALFWSRYLSEGGRARPLLFVLEEAHAYLNAGNDGAASVATRRIVKEGRKYGIGAMIVSQRPSEVDPTVLSQCGTMFAMRLTNPSDRAQVLGTVSDNLEGLLGMLPVLRTGEAIILGESVHLPLRATVAAPAQERRPESQDPRVYDVGAESGWNKSRVSEDYDQVVHNWRTENPRG